MIKKTSKRIILDKSFIQSENQKCSRLHLLRDAGAVFVLIDTFFYEFGTDSKLTQWPATQKKLFPFADNIEVWKHVSYLLKSEISNQKPVKSPMDYKKTRKVRNWFKSGEVYVPPDLIERSKPEIQAREIDTVKDILELSQKVCKCASECSDVKFKNGTLDPVFVDEYIKRVNLHEIIIRHYYANPDRYPNDIIERAEHGLNGEWFAYHEAKCEAALCRLFMVKHGLANTPGLDFAHSKLDADYLSLLHYADAFATNETSGSMADMCAWLYGDSKLIFNISRLDAAGSLCSKENLDTELWQRLVEKKV